MQQKPARQKKAVNLSIDSELVSEAKEAGLNLSTLLERALREHLRGKRWQKWRDDNRDAIEASNAELEKNGLWYAPDWLAK
jgi:antitoxin CcdA